MYITYMGSIICMTFEDTDNQEILQHSGNSIHRPIQKSGPYKNTCSRAVGLFISLFLDLLENHHSTF